MNGQIYTFTYTCLTVMYVHSIQCTFWFTFTGKPPVRLPLPYTRLLLLTGTAGKPMGMGRSQRGEPSSGVTYGHSR